MNPPILLGITGGIGSGKTAVASGLAAQGAAVIEADRLVHEAHARPAIRDRIVAALGKSVLDAAGGLDRRAIAARVFGPGADAETSRRALEAILHPAVREMIGERLAELASAASPPAVVVLDAPLVVEGPLRHVCDAIVFVDAPVELRRARTVSTRGWGPGELDVRERAQASLDEKRAASRYVIRNDGDPAGLATRCATLFRQVVADFPAGGRGARHGT